jgi:hypothetical protein
MKRGDGKKEILLDCLLEGLRWYEWIGRMMMMVMVILAGQLFLSKQSLLCLDGRERETHTPAPCTHESNTGTRTHATHADLENQPTRRGTNTLLISPPRQTSDTHRIAHPYPLRSYHPTPPETTILLHLLPVLVGFTSTQLRLSLTSSNSFIFIGPLSHLTSCDGPSIAHQAALRLDGAPLLPIYRARSSA